MGNIENKEQITSESQTATAEEIKTGDRPDVVSLGKFKDVKSLLDAYNSLQSEFTKRCQRLKELEGRASFEKTELSVSKEADGDVSYNAKSITDEEKKAILQDYLKGVLDAKQTAVVIDGAGVGVRTPVQKPKTISEAGVLAKEILQNK